MKVLIVGSDEIYAIENYYVQHLTDIGISVQLYPAQKFFFRYYQRSVVNKMICRIGLSSILSSINKNLKYIVTEFNPDVLWVFKGMEVFPSTLKWCKQRGIKLVNYNPDNPFIFSGTGSGNKNVTNSITLFDLHFTYNIEILEQLEQRGLNTKFLPFAFENSHEVNQVLKEENEIVKLCFIGNPDKERANFIMEIARRGIEVDLHGNQWDRFVNHPNLRIHEAIYGAQLLRALRKYRIQLNLMRVHNEDSHNMRTFEVPGVGGIMIAPSTKEHRFFFEENREAFFFKDINDAADSIKAILHLSFAEASAIRKAARSRSINSGYTYKDRSLYVAAELKNLVEGIYE